MDYNEIAGAIERFINGTSAPWEWDDYFLGTKYEDPYLRSVQRRVLGLSTEFPPATNSEYTGADGVEVLRRLVKELRSRSPE
jgi:hypothetical protein